MENNDVSLTDEHKAHQNEPKYLAKLSHAIKHGIETPIIMSTVDSLSDYEDNAQSAIAEGNIASLFEIINSVLPDYVSCDQFLLNCQDIDHINLEFSVNMEKNVPYLYPGQHLKMAPQLNNFLAYICRTLYKKVTEQMQRPDFQLMINREGVRVIYENVVDGFVIGMEETLF